MALGLQGGFGAKGGQDALETWIARRLAQQVQAEREREAVAREGLAQQELTQRQGQHTDRMQLGHDELGQRQSEFGFEQQQYADEAPLRQARQGYLIAQTADLTGKPQREQAEREHDVSMAGLRHTNDLGLATHEGRIRSGHISQQGRIDQSLKGGDKEASIDYGSDLNRRTVESIDDLDARVSRWNTGLGSYLEHLPESDALKFASDVESLKATLAFNELTEMRNASKTGGALGNVSNVELALLQNARGALNTRMRPEDFRANLKKVKESVQRWEQAKAKYGRPQTGATPVESGAPAKPSAKELLEKYRSQR